MEEYIEKNQLKKELHSLFKYESFPIGDIEQIIDGSSVIPKHGRWTYDGKHWICTVCKKIAPCDRDGEYVFSPYCHHCGARIDEVKE